MQTTTSSCSTPKNPPKIIFTTAYREYAPEGFDLNAVDYLLKPISFERFLQAINKVMQTNITANSSNQNPFNVAEKSHPFLYFRTDRKMVKVFLDDIFFIESLKDYIRIYTLHKTIVTKQPISSLEEILPKDAFIRIHNYCAILYCLEVATYINPTNASRGIASFFSFLIIHRVNDCRFVLA